MAHEISRTQPASTIFNKKARKWEEVKMGWNLGLKIVTK